MLGPYFSKNGELLLTEKAVIALDNIEYSYGFGVYENLKVRNRILYFPEMHIDRLFFSARQIGLTVPHDRKTIENHTIELIKRIKDESFNIKILLVGNKQGSDISILALSPSFIPKKAHSQGVKVMTCPGERQFPQAKTLNMLMSYLAYKKAKEQDAYDALLVDAKGRILEGTRTNLFFTDGKTIFTAPSDLVLNGVTRTTLFDALQNSKIPIEERILKKEDIEKYSGYFLTSTSSKVLPLSQIDDHNFKIPDIIKDTMELYESFLREYEQKAKKVLFED